MFYFNCQLSTEESHERNLLSIPILISMITSTHIIDTIPDLVVDFPEMVDNAHSPSPLSLT